MFNILSVSVLNCSLLKQIFILICNRKDLSLLLSLLNKLSNAILRVLIITELTALNTSYTVFIFSLFLKKKNSDLSSDIKIIVTNNTLNIS